MPSHSDLTVYKWRVVIEPYKDTGRWRFFRDRRWRWARESVYSKTAKLDKQGFASSHKAARRKALRGLAFDYDPYAKRAELVYAVATPKTQWSPKPSPLEAQLLKTDAL